MRNILVATVLLFAACSDAPLENQSNSSVVDSLVIMRDTGLPKPQSNVLDTVGIKGKTTLMYRDSLKIADAMSKNTQNEWVIMDTMTGDLNRDNYLDMLIVLESDAKFVATDEPRPLLILIGTADGEMKVAEQNDNVVLCQDCGGVFGDPYDGLAIKNGYFSVEHYGGSSWRWTKIITFKYNAEQKTWLLHRDAGSSFNVFEPDAEEPENVWNQEHYGKMKFVDYNSL